MALRTYLSILNDAAALFPQSAAFQVPDPASGGTGSRGWRPITYSQFANDVEEYAKYWARLLTSDGLPQKSIVGLWVGGFEYTDVLHIYGLTRAGYIPQLFPGRLPNSAVIYELMEMAGAKALAYDPTFGPVTDCPVVTHIARALCSDDVKGTPALPPTPVDVNAEDIVIIYHTSGSTGRLPKLVRCSYRWLESMITKTAHVTKPKNTAGQDVTVWMGSMAHSPQNFMLMGAIQHGSCTIQPTKVPYSAEEVLDMIQMCRLNRINVYSPLLTSLLRQSKKDKEFLTALARLDEVLYTGLALPKEDEDWAYNNGIKLTNIFGSTECGALLISIGGTGPEARLFHPIEDTAYGFFPIDSSDTAASHTKLLELVVLSQSGDCPEPSRRSEDGHFHTGDFFEELFPGCYASRGRDDDWIKLANAVRCDTKGMEDEVRAVCGDLVSECIIVGTGRRCPALFVETLSEMGKEDAEKIRLDIVRRMTLFNSRRYIEERIATTQLVFVVASGSLPRTTTKGNIRRKAVEETYREELDEAYEGLKEA
ncbi:unnamed protein product [Somion occarium]|uniref:AMP-dependent synthetase/ligase domain-containing protein n=1 Tax=Somion occarium TaxID=3059160 RepID=A0ABP1E2R5_9APHY